MKRCMGLILLLVPFLAAAASFWDGNAALQRGDASFESGMYAASNSFAPDTQVLIQNLETGKTATVTITKRVGGQADILVLLSPLAASSLGITQGTMASVRVTVTSRPPASESRQPSEQAYTQDPDLNPGVAYADRAQTDQAAARAPESSTPVTTSPGNDTGTTSAAAAPVAAEESLSPTEAPQAAMAAAEPAVTPEAPAEESTAAQIASTPQATPLTSAAPGDAAAVEKAEDAAIIADAVGRSPQKRVFLPPREDKTFAYQQQTSTEPAQIAPAAPEVTAVIGEPGVAPAPTPPEDVALAEATPPEESQPQEIVGTEVPPPAQAPEGADVALAEAAAPEESVAQEIVGAETPAPAPTSEGAAVALAEAAAPEESVAQEIVGAETPAPAPTREGAVVAIALVVPEAPSSEKPPETSSTTAGAASAQTLPRVTPQVTAIPRTGTYYVQLGAYATEKGAQELAAGLSPTYPILVLAPGNAGSRMYRVMIGPLNRAESGTLLVWFRFRGFPDAFVKQE